MKLHVNFHNIIFHIYKIIPKS
uniref:Uncharacterized protein n=1 Tax=Rhizophora mucronata TaxID=61149 RepID=A0A2P2NF85_RHIMU